MTQSTPDIHIIESTFQQDKRKYTTEYCTAEEFNSAQHKLYASDSDKYYEWNFNSNKKTSIEKAQERISNRIYYYNSLSSSGYYKITYNGFYTDIIQIKMYNNNYIEYRHVYKDYGIVNVEHHSPIIGTLNDTYSITYFE